MSARRGLHPVRPRGGICRYCRCTENAACVLSAAQMMFSPFPVHEQAVWHPRRNGKRVFTCSWINKQQTVCSNPSCVRKHKIHERAKRMRQRIRVRNGRQLHGRRIA